MESSDYFIAWGIYLVAATILAFMAWGVLKKYLWRELAYVLETTGLAILFTPWYVFPDQDLLAPAFMVFVMDSITINTTAGVRSLIPLVMAFLVGLLVSLVLIVMHRLSLRKQARADEAGVVEKRHGMKKRAPRFTENELT